MLNTNRRTTATPRMRVHLSTFPRRRTLVGGPRPMASRSNDRVAAESPWVSLWVVSMVVSGVGLTGLLVAEGFHRCQRRRPAGGIGAEEDPDEDGHAERQIHGPGRDYRVDRGVPEEAARDAEGHTVGPAAAG